MNLQDQNDSIGYLLIQIGKKRRNKTNAELVETGLHAGQDLLLYYLSVEDGQTISALAENLTIQMATVSNMVDRMVATGLLEKVKGTVDRRSSRIFMTDKGADAFKKVVEVWNSVEGKTTEGLSIMEKFLFKRMLHTVLKNLS